jgi:hypothetical protein
MTTRLTPTHQFKQRASAHIRQLAKDVHQTFPDMDVHQHLHDAAREIDAGRHDNAKRHLDAAINAFAPLHLIRHGIHDDEGHRAAKSFMQRAHRGRLLAADAEQISGANRELMHNRREAAMQQAAQKAAAGQPPGASAAPAAPAAVVPAAPVPAAKQLGWDDIAGAVELATFAGAKPGSGKNFAKLSASLAKRGARNPGALAAYIGRKKYGRKRFARLGRGHSHASSAGGIELAFNPDEPRGEHGRWMAVAGHIRRYQTAAKNGDSAGATSALRDAESAATGPMREELHRAVQFHASGNTYQAGQHVRRAAGMMGGEPPKRLPVGRDLRSAQVSREGGDSALADVQTRRAERNASPEVAAMLRRARVAREGGDSVLAGILERRARAMSMASDQQAIELRGYNPSQPRDTHGRWASVHASYHVGRTGPRQDAEGKFRSPGYGARHGNFGASYTPGSLDHIRAIWDLGTEAGSRTENRSPTMRNALHNVARAVTRRDMRAARAHLAEAKVANRREALGVYTNDLRALEDQLDRVPRTVGNWMEQADPLTYQGQHLGRYVDRTGGSPPFNPTAGAYSHSRSGGRLSAARMAGMSEMSTGWDDVLHAIELSADTGRLASTPHPFGKPDGPGLWGVKGMELPPYIQNIARALLRKGRAKNLSQAIAMAKGATARWATGKNTRPEVRAASAETNASWAAKQARAHAHANDPTDAYGNIYLSGTAAGAAKDPRIAAGQAGGGRFGSGGGAAAGQARPAQSRAQRKAALLAAAKADRARAKLLAIRIAADRAALASASGKTSKGQKGATTAAKRSTTGTSAPAAKGTAAKAARTANPLSNAATGLTPQQLNKASVAAVTQARHMSKAQLTTAIKALTAQEKQLLAKAAGEAAQAGKM